MIVLVLWTKPSGLYRHRRGLGLHRVGYREGNLPSGHGTKSSILYLHSPTVRPKYIVRLSEDPLIQDSLRDGGSVGTRHQGRSREGAAHRGGPNGGGGGPRGSRRCSGAPAKLSADRATVPTIPSSQEHVKEMCMGMGIYLTKNGGLGLLTGDEFLQRTRLGRRDSKRVTTSGVG